MTNTPPRRVVSAAIWAVMAIFATAAVLPYTIALTPDLLEKAKVSLPVLAALQSVQAGVVVFALSWIGLRLGSDVGLGNPLLDALRAKRPLPTDVGKTLSIAAAAGALAGAAIVGLDAMFSSLMPAASQPVHDIAWWKGLLASFYGGIVEEIQLRLFFMTLIAWLLSRVFRNVRTGIMIAALVLAAVAFGAGHLPMAAKLWSLTPVVITRTIVLNAVGGIVFGFLYWKRGLEHAMAAHFSADIVLHVIAASILQ
jgi:hypothetical protein